MRVARAERAQEFGGDFDGTPAALHGPQPQHAGAFLEHVGHGFDVRHVGQPAPHEAFGRDNRVSGIGNPRAQGIETQFDAAVATVMHDGRHQRPTFFVGQAHGNAVSDRCDQ